MGVGEQKDGGSKSICGTEWIPGQPGVHGEIFVSKEQTRNSEMSHQAKTLATKPDGLNSIPRTKW